MYFVWSRAVIRLVGLAVLPFAGWGYVLPVRLGMVHSQLRTGGSMHLHIKFIYCPQICGQILIYVIIENRLGAHDINWYQPMCYNNCKNELYQIKFVNPFYVSISLVPLIDLTLSVQLKDRYGVRDN